MRPCARPQLSLLRLLLLLCAAPASSALRLTRHSALRLSDASTGSALRLARHFARAPTLQLSDASAPAAPPPAETPAALRRRVDTELFAIAAPALVGLSIDPIASLVDTAFLGRCCSAADLAGAGIATSVFNLVARTFNFLSSATTSAVAAASPSADACAADGDGCAAGSFTPEMVKVVSAAVTVAVAIGACLAVGLSAFGGPLLGALGIGADSALRSPARRYLAARALAAPASLSLMALQGSFRGARDTTTPLGPLTLASALNIALDPIFIVLLRGGVGGAALATTASQYAAAALLWRRLAVRLGESEAAASEQPQAGGLRILGLPRPDLADCARIGRAGSWLTVRTFACTAALSGSSVAASALDVAASAAHQIAFQLWLATSLLADSVALGAQALMATALARRDAPTARAVTRRTLTLGLGSGAITAAALALAGPARTAGAFSSSAPVLAAAALAWPLVVWTQPLNTLAFAVDGLIFGASDFAYCALGMLGSALPALLLMHVGVARGGGLAAVWRGLGAFMALRAALGGMRIASGRGPWRLLQS